MKELCHNVIVRVRVSCAHPAGVRKCGHRRRNAQGDRRLQRLRPTRAARQVVLGGVGGGVLGRRSQPLPALRVGPRASSASARRLQRARLRAAGTRQSLALRRRPLPSRSLHLVLVYRVLVFQESTITSSSSASSQLLFYYFNDLMLFHSTRTCSFFMLKMPRYSCKWVLREKLRYACYFCNTINLDDYSHVPATAATYGGPLSPSSRRASRTGAAARLSIGGVGELPTGVEGEASPSDSEHDELVGSSPQAPTSNAASLGVAAGRAPTAAMLTTIRCVEMATRQEYGAPKPEARIGADSNAGAAAGRDVADSASSSNHTAILEDSQQQLMRMLSELIGDSHNSNHDRDDPSATTQFFNSPPRVRSPSSFLSSYRTTYQPPAPPNLLSLAASRQTPGSTNSHRNNTFLQQIGGPPVLPPHALLTASDRERLETPLFRFGRSPDRPAEPSHFDLTYRSSMPRAPRERAPIDSDDDLNF